MFWLLREMQTWLHRHIFKVGWLVTKNFETTTILYYTVFLPGVFLNQFTIWLAAGAFNVRAEKQIGYPEKQEIGELKLDFVKLGKKVSPIILNLIQLIPFVVGLIVIWLIAVHAFDIFTVLELLADPEQGLGLSLQYMFTRPDFWLWSYFVFTIANTMLPDTAVFKGMRLFMVIGAIIVVLMIFDGNTGDISGVIVPPILSISNGLSLLFGVIIAVDAVATILLAAIENSIEIITGDSATFKNGKMIAMKRADIIAQRKADREKEQRKREREKAKPAALPAGGPPSIYALDLPLPDPPGSLPRRLILESEPVPELDQPRHRDPDVIVTEDVKAEADEQETIKSTPSRPASPFISDHTRTTPSMSPSKVEDEDDFDDEDIDDDSQEEDNEAQNIRPEKPAISSSTPKPFIPVSRRSPLVDDSEDEDDDIDDDDETLSDNETEKSRAMPSSSRINPFNAPVKRDEDSSSDKASEADKRGLPSRDSGMPSSVARKPLFERPDRYASAMQRSGDSDAKSTRNAEKAISADDKPKSPANEEPRAKPTGLLKNRSERINPFSSGLTKPVPKPVSQPDKSPSQSDDEDSLDDLRSDVDDDIEYEDIYNDYTDEVSEDEIDERF